jgi:O-antigen/teichoic acid export membrane protein
MLSFTVSSISSGLYSQIDIVMLGFLGTTSMVGIYQLAFKIKNVLGSAIGSVGNVMLPRLSYFTHGGKKKEFEDLLAKNFSFIITSGLALTSICILCSKDIVLLLGGPEFVSSAMPLMVIAPILLMSPLSLMLAQHLIATNRERAYAFVNFSTLCCAIILSLLFVPWYGALGAAISVGIAELITLCVRLILLRNFVLSVFRQLSVWKPLVSCLIADGVAIILQRFIGGFAPFASLVLITLVFCVAYLSLLLLTKDRFMTTLLGERIFHKRASGVRRDV